MQANVHRVICQADTPGMVATVVEPLSAIGIVRTYLSSTPFDVIGLKTNGFCHRLNAFHIGFEKRKKEKKRKREEDY